MHHYVYLLSFNNGMKYVGVHSTKIPPEMDVTYLGSGKKLPKRNWKTCSKEVIKTFQSREAATSFEAEYINKFDCVNSPNWYNQRVKTHDRFGETREISLGTEIAAKKLKGRTKETHEHLRIKGKTFSDRYKGARTPALLDADKRRAETIRGTKNPNKGRPGILNNGFNPWYYITPDGKYVEVHDKTKEQMAEVLGFTSRQLGHGFHYTNQHKKAKVLPRKGWTFGNLPRPDSREN